ncbi:DEAD/DEAH box helicase [Marinigracilibium pacificum]|uniref:DEAD/DEAH box helicase family protein n=1 Tax=Marinigracilibium pacificum TaxID=2729599 RepID=A0A848IUI5_9BACT|nr:SNF2-related protein [Marinigracilibium pacificum]NMM46955.1 DEAD/DEAH box helicase family protein [Marinigracilibium pacificum]
MKVSSAQPFQIIYSVFEHEYLGYLFESYIVHLDDNGGLTFQHQNISIKNADEFSSGLDEVDYELIELMDSMQQDVVSRKFSKKPMKTEDFFLKVFDKEKGNDLIQKEIERYLDIRRAEILKRIPGKRLFEMGSDGEPAWKEIFYQEKAASILFHFHRNEDNTHYWPTIKHNGVKVDFSYKDAYILCNEPAYMVVEGRLYHFEKNPEGKKLIPFLRKKFILIPGKIEETYYEKFVCPLIANFDVSAKGFQINNEAYGVNPYLYFSTLAAAETVQGSLFDDKKTSAGFEDREKILFELKFKYGPYEFKGEANQKSSVRMEKTEDSFLFHKVSRDPEKERQIIQYLKDIDLLLKHGRLTMSKQDAFAWLTLYKFKLEEKGFKLIQKDVENKKYFLGQPSINIEVNEKNDWFDIHAIIEFGDYKIPFKDLRKYIVKKKKEFSLPNGEIAVIPEAWFTKYGELFSFMHENGEESAESMSLNKHHVALVDELKHGNLAKVNISTKLELLKDFTKIEDYPLPESFSGELRPYQKAGFNWMKFLNNYNFGGCLADDMGLGKTVQTLALLQDEKDKGMDKASLLIMPTSLLYNWQKEAEKFTPNLKVFLYTGTNREKDVNLFEGYDIILTSYGIVRLDIDILKNYFFNYIILDESQVIKNPNSNIAKAVRDLRSKFRLILTGTPLENTTLDLWSQMSFVNPGLLGSQSFFKNEFLQPIEKNQDESKIKKLYNIIKPFILRRHKSQVATELPPKVENVIYTTMSQEQEEKYEEVKSFYRNKIMDEIELQGMKKSRMMVLQGLTKLRQLANHPKMVEPDYKGESGKLDDVMIRLHDAISDDHKVLVFSQFVKHLDIVKKQLDKDKIKYCYLDGSTKDRQAQVDKFQDDQTVKVFLISLKAGGLGLNLTKADYVFLLDPWWNPAIEAQAVDRAHRIGQTNQVFTYKFIMRNTVEEKILTLQQSKLQLANELINTEESFMKSLDKSDIEALFT